jgi:hypothetical protein
MGPFNREAKQHGAAPPMGLQLMDYFSDHSNGHFMQG